jgi:hypothetical protein
MSDPKVDLERLREDLDHLRERIPADTIEAEAKQSEGNFERQVKRALAKSSDTIAIGVSRAAVLANQSGRTHSSNHQGVWTGPIKELPSEEKLRASATVLAHTPFQMRAMFRLLCRFYDGQQMRLTARELAAAMGVEEPELERELAPLVTKKTLVRFKTPEGEDGYELKRWDLFLLQLSLA